MTDLTKLTNSPVIEDEELSAEFSTRKSFYGKAHVLTLKNGVKLLKSYNTIVAIAYDDGKINFAINGKYSGTTTSHQREFIHQFGGVDIKPRDLNKYVEQF